MPLHRRYAVTFAGTLPWIQQPQRGMLLIRMLAVWLSAALSSGLAGPSHQVLHDVFNRHMQVTHVRALHRARHILQVPIPEVGAAQLMRFM